MDRLHLSGSGQIKVMDTSGVVIARPDDIMEGETLLVEAYSNAGPGAEVDIDTFRRLARAEESPAPIPSGIKARPHSWNVGAPPPVSANPYARRQRSMEALNQSLSVDHRR